MPNTGFLVKLDKYPLQMWYLPTDRYESRQLVNITSVTVLFPDHIAPQLFIEGIEAHSGAFAVSADGGRFRQLKAQSVATVQLEPEPEDEQERRTR